MGKIFDSKIQPGDEIIYSDSLEARVNLSQLRRVAKKDFRERYKRISKSEWFKKAYDGKSIGEVIPIVE